MRSTGIAMPLSGGTCRNKPINMEPCHDPSVTTRGFRKRHARCLSVPEVFYRHFQVFAFAVLVGRFASVGNGIDHVIQQVTDLLFVVAVLPVARLHDMQNTYRAFAHPVSFDTFRTF